MNARECILKPSQRIRLSGVPSVWYADAPDKERGWAILESNDGVQRLCLTGVGWAEELKEADRPTENYAPADQVVRLALDAETGDQIVIHTPHKYMVAKWDDEPEQRDGWRFPKARKTFVPSLNIMAAVAIGELTLAEQSAVVLENLTLDALGLKSGDEVEILAAKDSETIVSKTVKAYAITDHARDKRGMDKPAYNQLPWVFMGEALREQLGISARDYRYPKADKPAGASTVIVRPKSSFQMIDHSWELLLVVIGALLALTLSWTTETANGMKLKLLIIAGVLAAAAGLLFDRVRRRLR